jgi:hypothetical protein
MLSTVKLVTNDLTHMDIKSYRNYKLNVDNKIDSIDIKFIKNDTIIMVTV